ncbi:MAG TPA: hypothetical protein VIL99_11985 [Ignavibacteria bacterium]
MFKWDKISWIASAIFAIVILLGAFIDNSYLYLLILPYFFRPTIMALGGARKYTDERQKFIQYHSGNIALTVLIIAIIIFAIIDQINGKPTDTYNILIVITLVTKALVGLILIRDYKSAGVRTGIYVAFFYAIFVTFGAFNIIFSLKYFLIFCPAIVVAGMSLTGNKYPFVSFVFFSLIGLLSIVLLATIGPEGNYIQRIVMGFVLSVPLFVTSFFFYKGARVEKVSGKEISD